MAAAVANHLGFSEDRRSDIGIVVTELATNILMHARMGEVLLCPIQGRTEWLDILALDSGPGIHDVARAFEDGVSTGGSAGQGLGAVRRLADLVSMYSAPDAGTVILCRFSVSQSLEAPVFGVVNIPMHGEIECGDSYLALPGPSRSLYMVVDGLGHGPVAATAAAAAKQAVQDCAQEHLAEIVQTTHRALQPTRGAAMSIAIVDHERSLITYAGVGNIGASVGNQTITRSMISRNGTLGAMLPRIQEYTYPFEPGMMLLMFSDGLTSKCGFSGYAGLANRPPALVAGLLYRDFSRHRDDATVLVASLRSSRP